MWPGVCPNTFTISIWPAKHFSCVIHSQIVDLEDGRKSIILSQDCVKVGEVGTLLFHNRTLASRSTMNIRYIFFVQITFSIFLRGRMDNLTAGSSTS